MGEGEGEGEEGETKTGTGTGNGVFSLRVRGSCNITRYRWGGGQGFLDSYMLDPRTYI